MCSCAYLARVYAHHRRRNQSIDRATDRPTDRQAGRQADAQGHEVSILVYVMPVMSRRFVSFSLSLSHYVSAYLEAEVIDGRTPVD